jgi:replicative DNA helicase
MASTQKIDKNTIITESIFDRVPPQALDAEMAVLGSMLIDNDCIGKIVEILESTHFYRTAHRKIFSSALTLYEKNEPVDLITLSEELKRQKTLEEVGGSYYLTELAETVPSSANVEHHARIVLERALLRKLIEESAGIAKECYEATDNVYDILDRSEQKIFGLSDKRLRSTFQHLSPIMHEAFETIERFHQRKGTVTGIPSGFIKLDELTSGFQPSELIIVAGRPSMGKTAFSLNVARTVAVEDRTPVGIFSLEMSKRSTYWTTS